MERKKQSSYHSRAYRFIGRIRARMTLVQKYSENGPTFIRFSVMPAGIVVGREMHTKLTDCTEP